MAEKYDIFISYRREGGFETAKLIYNFMSHDGYKVSFDIDTLRNGDFDTELLRRIDQCADFVLILNKGAFDRCLDSSIKRENDWMRNELAYALQKGKNIIPIMLEGFTEFPENLPDDIFRVSRKNGPKYDKYYFEAFYKRLKKFLETPPPAPRNATTEQTADDIGTIIQLETDLDCQVFKRGTLLCTVRVGEDKTIRLRKGKHKLEFVSIENPTDCYSTIFSVEDNDSEDVLPIELKSIRDKRVKEEEEETQRILNIPDRKIVRFKDETTSKRGFKIKSTNEIIISPKYDAVGHFSERLTWVKLNGKCGYIDKTGKEITPCKYEFVWDFSDGLAIVGLNGKRGYIDKTGKEIIPLIYNYAGVFSEGLASVEFNGKYGFINKTGKEVIPCKYDNVFWGFSQGKAKVELNGETFHINKTGKRIH